jgi:preprotein translocase subunit SecF
VTGYSTNDTIVIFDRVREEPPLAPARVDERRWFNLSINQTLGPDRC